MSDQTLKATRQQSLITLLSQSDWLTTEVLAEKLSVSKETIRRDLKSLQQQGEASAPARARASDSPGQPRQR